MDTTALRQLPSVDRLLSHPGAPALIAVYGRPLMVEALRAVLDTTREGARHSAPIPADDLLIEQARRTLEEWLAPTLQRVINATGVIIHTNLGRAPLSTSTVRAISEAASGYSTLEYDLESGKRGSRSLHAEGLITRLTGAEAALVVNNCASAVLLTLTALAGPAPDHPTGRGVLISRGQLIEIGGGFRVPDVMRQSGAQLVEVGTTNRTHRHDYEQAIQPDAALIFRAHRSNFALVGFTTEPDLNELVTLAHVHGLLCVDDLGSGALLDTTPFGLAAEPLVQESIRAGADVVMFSGDKLLGGPQAGILAGRAAIIERLKRHPLARAVRADKLCLSGLAATLTHYLVGDALEQIPVWRMIAESVTPIRGRARRWARSLNRAGLSCKVIDGESTVGGGSLPGTALPTALLSIEHPAPDRMAAGLRHEAVPVIVRIEDDRLVIDPRTVLPGDEPLLLASLRRLAL
ncbi:MAG: L-seryl-tRNA(Sec) selenium transferase [Anaerolineae bacterium]|nr:L-seryl-tRNA(Sec) selenium transferase [Anaerolineae bacterium]